jgi:hypothetical protein
MPLSVFFAAGIMPICFNTRRPCSPSKIAIPFTSEDEHARANATTRQKRHLNCLAHFVHPLLVLSFCNILRHAHHKRLMDALCGDEFRQTWPCAQWLGP